MKYIRVWINLKRVCKIYMEIFLGGSLMPLNNFALGKNIRHFRKKRGLSQSYLSELIDRSPTYLSYVESGMRCISLDTLVDLANALNVTSDALLKESLTNSALVMTNEFAAVLGDCTENEQRILLEVMIAVKASMRTNSTSHR